VIARREGCAQHITVRGIGRSREASMATLAVPERGIPNMGDKSPKSKDRAKKQDSAQKKTAKDAAKAKQTAPVIPAKKGK
jgi:hypothetical protein